MTLADALDRAVLLGLVATEEDGFCVLRRPGGGIEARGSNWPECFARLGAAQASASEREAQRLLNTGGPASNEPPPGQLF